MERRTILALVLIFVVFWLSNEFLWKDKSSEEHFNREIVSEQVIDPVVSSGEAGSEDVRSQRLDTSLQEDLAFLTEEIPLNDSIILHNGLVSFTFTNRGAVLTSAQLLNFTHFDQENRVNLIPSGESLFGLSINTAEETLDIRQRYFNWEKGHIDGYPALTFHLGRGTDRSIEKRFILREDYDLVMEIASSGIGLIESYTVNFGSGIKDTEEFIKHKNDDYRFIAQTSVGRTTIALKRINSGETLTGSFDWAAVRSKYFMMALMPEQRLQTEKIDVYKNNESPAFDLTIRQSRMVSEISDEFRVFLGPLDYNILVGYENGMEETIELGWKVIRPLGRFFLWLLTKINSLIGNYGFTIIIFAFLLKMVLYPLTHKSFESTHKMQKMSPHMQEIQKKYKSDPKTMQAELQKLYKEHGVNPLGGCLPLLLQMPVFFALYPVLRYSVELRQASFMLWLTDLSEPDPYMILPILMGIFMFVQQKMMMPKHIDKDKMDEKQKAQMQSQKMMLYIMPVFMVFIFRGLPSGLVLYWTIFNVFSIFQQYFITKKHRS